MEPPQAWRSHHTQSVLFMLTSTEEPFRHWPSSALKCRCEVFFILPSWSSSDLPPAPCQHRTGLCRQSTGWPRPRSAAWIKPLWLRTCRSSPVYRTGCSTLRRQWLGSPAEKKRKGSETKRHRPRMRGSIQENFPGRLFHIPDGCSDVFIPPRISRGPQHYPSRPSAPAPR